MKNLYPLDLSEDASIPRNECALISLAVALGARTVSGWSAAEEDLAKNSLSHQGKLLHEIKSSIQAGEDPLGDFFCFLRTPEVRRVHGATYTPLEIVRSMLNWAEENGQPERIIDPGVGSARFLLEGAKRFPKSELFGVEIDPVSAIVARANLAVLGLSNRSRIIVDDYCKITIPKSKGKTLFIGNPPYVRHHLLSPDLKTWLTQKSASRGLIASQLSGLHVYFYLATVLNSSPGDFGTFITASEWLDVNYGKLIRDLFLGDLGGKRIIVIEPTALPFPDAITTAAITQFEISSKPKTIKLKRVASAKQISEPNGNRTVRRERLETERRWSHMTRQMDKPPSGFVELGEICRVHRGQVTGANAFWVLGSNKFDLPKSVLYPSITKAKELFNAGQSLNNTSMLRHVVDLPVDLDGFDELERKAIDQFLKKARDLGVHLGYVASNRRAWWSVGLRKPAPILSTYMARRPPAFVVNKVGARHINIAHGLYPRENMSDQILNRLAQFLSKSVSLTSGRTYAGGLTKFEPREMERLFVPTPKMLSSEND